MTQIVVVSFPPRRSPKLPKPKPLEASATDPTECHGAESRHGAKKTQENLINTKKYGTIVISIVLKIA